MWSFSTWHLVVSDAVEGPLSLEEGMLLAHLQLEHDAEGGGCLGRHSEKTLPAHSSSATRSRGYIYTHDLGVAHTTL